MDVLLPMIEESCKIKRAVVEPVSYTHLLCFQGRTLSMAEEQELADVIGKSCQIQVVCLVDENQVTEQHMKQAVDQVAGEMCIRDRGINSVGGWARDKGNSLQDLADAQAENKALQEQVDELTLQNSRLMQNQYRLQELEALYNLSLIHILTHRRRLRIISWRSYVTRSRNSCMCFF